MRLYLYAYCTSLNIAYLPYASIFDTATLLLRSKGDVCVARRHEEIRIQSTLAYKTVAMSCGWRNVFICV